MLVVNSTYWSLVTMISFIGELPLFGHLKSTFRKLYRDYKVNLLLIENNHAIMHHYQPIAFQYWQA